MEQYDLCIVCVPEDTARAEELAESIRRYQLPKAVAAKLPGAGKRSVLVENSGSDFETPVKGVLDRSRNMAVICSPAVRTHRGLCDRLAYFRAEKGEDSVIGVLVEGEPSDSFPENFIQTKTVRQTLPDGTEVELEDTIEPVAADLRGATAGRRRQLLKYETVRITASILNIHPDVLEQRQRRRRKRAFIALASVVGAVCLAASAIFLRLGFIAKNEGDIAAKQTLLSLRIAERTINELPRQFEDNPEALGYINETIADAKAVIEEHGLGDLLSGEGDGK